MKEQGGDKEGAGGTPTATQDLALFLLLPSHLPRVTLQEGLKTRKKKGRENRNHTNMDLLEGFFAIYAP